MKTVEWKGSVFGKEASETHRFKNDFYSYNSNCLGIISLMTDMDSFTFSLSRIQLLNT